MSHDGAARDVVVLDQGQAPLAMTAEITVTRRPPRSWEKRNDVCAARLTVALFGLVFQPPDQVHFLLLGYAALSG